MERDRALTEGKKYISSLNKYCFLRALVETALPPPAEANIRSGTAQPRPRERPPKGAQL